MSLVGRTDTYAQFPQEVISFIIETLGRYCESPKKKEEKLSFGTGASGIGAFRGLESPTEIEKPEGVQARTRGGIWQRMAASILLPQMYRCDQPRMLE